VTAGQAGQTAPWQDCCHTMSKQAEQRRPSDGNQFQPRVQWVTEKSLVMRQV